MHLLGMPLGIISTMLPILSKFKTKACMQTTFHLCIDLYIPMQVFPRYTCAA